MDCIYNRPFDMQYRNSATQNDSYASHILHNNWANILQLRSNKVRKSRQYSNV
jgi:hypothetical protein